MTIICGIETTNGFVVGADSGVFGDYDRSISREPKIFTLSRKAEVADDSQVDIKMTIGVAGSIRLAQLLKYRLMLPVYKPDSECYDLRWLATDVIDSIRQCFSDNGFNRKEDEVDTFGDYSLILVGLNSKIYVIFTDYHVSTYQNGMVAIGAAEDFALGAMFATDGYRDTAARVLAGLNASIEFCNYVAKPFIIQEWEDGNLINETTIK